MSALSTVSGDSENRGTKLTNVQYRQPHRHLCEELTIAVKIPFDLWVATRSHCNGPALSPSGNAVDKAAAATNAVDEADEAAEANAVEGAAAPPASEGSSAGSTEGDAQVLVPQLPDKGGLSNGVYPMIRAAPARMSQSDCL